MISHRILFLNIGESYICQNRKAAFNRNKGESKDRNVMSHSYYMYIPSHHIALNCQYDPSISFSIFQLGIFINKRNFADRIPVFVSIPTIKMEDSQQLNITNGEFPGPFTFSQEYLAENLRTAET